MPLIKIIYGATLASGDISSAYSTPLIPLDGAQTFSAQCSVVVDTPSAKTFVSGTSEKVTATFPSLVGATAGDYFVVYDSAGLGWAAALNTTGSSPAPTGAVWASIASARKVNVDISLAVTATDVASAVDTAFIALAAFPFTTVLTAGADAITCTIRGLNTAPSVHNADDSGVGSITVAITTPGVASKVNVTNNTFTIASHGYATGLKLRATSTGTLPAGITTGVDYFAIIVDANTIKVASSLANALLGTAIDITDQGSDGATNTLTATTLAGATIALEKSNDGLIWSAEGSPVSIAATAVVWLENTGALPPTGNYMRITTAMTAGQMTVSSNVVVKGPN